MMKNHFVTSVTSARFQSKGADLSILIVLPCILGIQVPPAFASDAMNQSARFVIGAQDIEAALHEWSRQTDIQVMVGATDAAGQRTEGVHGRLIAANALTQLLQNTDLTYERVADSTVAVKRIAAVTEAEVSLDSPPMKRETGSRALAGFPDAGKQPRGALEEALEEVIVTAQKRKERLQDVPISISVLRGDELDRSTVEGISEALNRVPGVATTVTGNTGGTQIQMRGVTAAGPLFTGSSPVAYYLDSVPLGLVRSAIVPDSNAYDLSRVEVLRGPQGTLYGASAQNGLVRIITKDANLSELELKARTSVASTEHGGDTYRGDVAVNVPIVSGKVGARAVVGYQDIGGWIDKPNDQDANSAEIANMRLKINAQLTDRVSIGLLGWRSRADYDALSYASDDFQRNTGPEKSLTDYDAYGLNIGYEYEGVSISSMTSYLDYVSAGDLTFLPTPLLLYTGIDTHIFSQEIIVSSTRAKSWRWTVGGFYRDADEGLEVRLTPVIPRAANSFESESIAVFGEVTRLMLDGRLELTAGLRHFEDDVTMSEEVSALPLPPTSHDTRTFDTVSPRLVLTWMPSVDLTLYASYAEGFRSGFNQGPNTARVAPNYPPVGEDTLSNYELGAKGDLVGDHLKFDAAIYYIDWKDLQQFVNVTQDGVTFGAAINGKSASGLGFDLALTAQSVDGLALSLSFSWNDLTMDGDVLSAGTVLFAEGDRVDRSPEYTAGASADYLFELGGTGLRSQFSVSASYTSEQMWTELIAGTRYARSGNDILIARTSFAIFSSDGRWAATLFADNVNNENGAPLRRPVFGMEALRVRPRTLGVQLEYRY